MRPKVSEETSERLEATVDRVASVPASHLTHEQRVSYLLDVIDTLAAQHRLDAGDIEDLSPQELIELTREAERRL